MNAFLLFVWRTFYQMPVIIFLVFQLLEASIFGFAYLLKRMEEINAQ